METIPLLTRLDNNRDKTHSLRSRDSQLPQNILSYRRMQNPDIVCWEETTLLFSERGARSSCPSYSGGIRPFIFKLRVVPKAWGCSELVSLVVLQGVQ